MQKLTREEKIEVYQKEFLSMDEASEVLGVSRSYMYKLKEKSLRPVESSHGMVYLKEDVLKALEDRTKAFERKIKKTENNLAKTKKMLEKAKKEEKK